MGEPWPRSVDRRPMLILRLLEALPDIRTKQTGPKMKTFIEASAIPDGTVWTKGGRSGAAGHCVVTADVNGGVAIGHSKDPGKGAFLYTPEEMDAFLRSVKDGDFDHHLL